MKHIYIYIISFFIILQCHEVLAQNAINVTQDKTFTVRGSVRESDTYKPIPKVNIEVNGGAYTKTDEIGVFRIKVKKGDQLVIRHKDFETVYYTIVNDDRITIEVEPVVTISKFSINKRNIKAFNSVVDSAASYLNEDLEKSIKFIADALEISNSVKQNAEAYELLADAYMNWKQYDLAITNYKISIQNSETKDAKLKLADAYMKHKNYQESLDIYQSIDEKSLSNWQKIVWYEGLGDTHFLMQNYDKAINFYTKGLEVAKKHIITPKITDLNSKIAQAFSENGRTDKAKMFFSRSLNLAEKENKKRAIEEKTKVADFQNTNRDYEEEIQLRKDAVDDIYEIETDSVFSNESPITPQKQNYKIGNAYLLQKDYNNAIPYFEKSIKEANSRGDLIVKKDATKKVSDVYKDAGNYEKALEAYKAYTEVVDELYIKKEQELSQASIFRRRIAETQNRITGLESNRALSQSKYELTIERNKRQQLIIYSLTGGLLLLLVTGFLMYKYIKQQKFANNLLALKSLRSQMNPHFIFNALNSVNSFIASNDERTANKYLSDFSHLMRAVLENSEEDFIPLEKEIELIELYTKLEHFRFKDKFEYTINVDESINIQEFQIPPMLLQPYIENAVWHGLRYKKEKGHLNISIRQKNKDELSISITDDGIGRERSKSLKTDHQKKQNSKGMGNIKKRVAILNKMYKDKVDVFIDDFQNTEDTGTKVVVTLKKD